MATKMTQYIIIITGASSGFGAMAARLLAQQGHIVYAGTRAFETEVIGALDTFSREEDVQLHPIDLDITKDQAVTSAVQRVIDEQGRIDVLIHNAGHGSMGPAEAFSLEQLWNSFDVNVMGAQRLNQAALPYMRKTGHGLVMWVSSSSVKGGAPPFCGPYFAAKAAGDSLAVSYAGELARWGIETAIIVPGAYPVGTSHFADMTRPANQALVDEYFQGPYAGVPEQIVRKLTDLFPPSAEAAEVAKAMVRIVQLPHGKRPFRTHVDPSNDGCEIVNAMHDRIRAELLRRVDLQDVLSPTKLQLHVSRSAP